MTVLLDHQSPENLGDALETSIIINAPLQARL